MLSDSHVFAQSLKRRGKLVILKADSEIISRLEVITFIIVCRIIGVKPDVVDS